MDRFFPGEEAKRDYEGDREGRRQNEECRQRHQTEAERNAGE
jgi:hypothetical protein